MTNLWKERLATKKIIPTCGIFIIIVLVFEITAGCHFLKKTVPNADWTVTINGEPTSLSAGSVMPLPLEAGDVLSCTSVIPDCGFSYPALIFETTDSAVSVTCGGKTLYTSSNESDADYANIMTNQVPLKEADFSKPVSISITAGRNNSIFSVPQFIYTEQKDGFATFLKARGFTAIIALLLLVTGIIGTVICSTTRILGKKLLPLITISQFALWTAICVLCHIGIIRIFIHNETVIRILTLASFYLSILFSAFIIYPELTVSKKKKHIFKMVACVYLAYCVLSLLIPEVTGFSCTDTFMVSLCIIIAIIAYTTFTCTRLWISQPEKLTYPAVGFLILVAFSIVEEIRKILHSAGLSVLGTPEMLLLNTGILTFVTCSLVDYFIQFKRSTIQETVEESWKRFSEPNSKPGISGFQKTMALLNELQDAKTQYTVATVSIDNVEELKKSVVPYPSLEDNFARLLHLVFSPYGITGNLGKGRFLVAAPDMPEGKMKQLLSAFEELVRRDNENHPEATIRYSCGYARSTDSDNERVVEICQLANNSRKAQSPQLLQ